ncbi:helix-turn-helix transcriptional regulator [Gloeocapsa sp. PCC 73106]|uniref:ArsR/SmtB family transcription factor n=1 Tax=Gloeocapsa sp. PCC 73106 TaxID=102232 RepID=UPI0002AC97CE|nr:metalloregulator ArsR/SmtB family transcription factor [Gloeocapsa sp. PCC 73106]ELR99683.1 putative transcriptional regulator [Gloeocapsa sp. PCC 73106]
MNTINKANSLKLSPLAISLMADFFKVLAEESRIHILCSLKSGEKSVSEIIEATGLGQANVSKHLKILNQAGLVSREQQGINVFYQISNPFLFELCDLVCSSIAWQVDLQNQQLAELPKF